MEIDRIYGATRYETSAKIAQRIDYKGNIVVATGMAFPDALSIAPIAAAEDMPILLVRNNEISKSVKEYLDNIETVQYKKAEGDTEVDVLGIEKTFVIGGTGVINDEVFKALKNPVRIGGKNRYETNTKVVEYFKDKINFDNVYLATGTDFPDALSGSVLAQGKKAPILLVADGMEKSHQDNIKGYISKSKNRFALGGKGAVTLKSLYLVGLEKNPPPEPPKPPTKPTEPSIPQAPVIKTMTVANDSESTRINIRTSPSTKASIAGYTYGSTSEVKILGTSGDWYYIETKNYANGNNVRGYMPKWLVKTVTTSKPYTIVVSISQQKVYIYNNSTLIRQTLCSTGVPGCDTPTGRFLIGDRGPSFGQDKGYICYNFMRIWHNYLFHSVLYYTDGKTVIAHEAAKLGQKASHGCIRLPIDQVRWMYQYIPRNTPVIIQ